MIKDLVDGAGLPLPTYISYRSTIGDVTYYVTLPSELFTKMGFSIIYRGVLE